MAYTKTLLFFVLVAVFSPSLTNARKRNATQIQFYMHDTPGGPNPSAVRVAGQPINTTGSDMSAFGFGFGSIYVMDNALTATPEVNSTLIGRAQGLYVVSSQENGPLSLLMTLTYSFVSGLYNGSSLSIVGRNPVQNEVREMPVVGGTGVFRLARGFALAKTHSMNQVDAIIGYNVTVIPFY